jgi:hypothetical protein
MRGEGEVVVYKLQTPAQMSPKKVLRHTSFHIAPTLLATTLHASVYHNVSVNI